MMKIKKILAILLAFCFLVSVTAATAAAGDSVVVATEEKTAVTQFTQVTQVTKEKKTLVEEKKSEENEEEEEEEEEEQEVKEEEHDKKEKKFEHQKKFEHHKQKKHFHPGHWGKHRVGHKKFDKVCGCYKFVYVYEAYFYKGYWSYD